MIELVVFAMVALIVSLTVDLAAELSLSDALERVRTTFGMTSARKLEPEPADPRHLITEPGMGYRFEP